MQARIASGLTALGLTPPDGAAARLAEYGRLLLEQNQVMNLTAITEPDQVADLHFLDSAALLTLGEDLRGKRLIDVGTGAGFPGLPLRILEPSLQLTLLDSLGTVSYTHLDVYKRQPLSPAASAAFSDAEGTWAAEVIEKAEGYGLMNGYPDGTFGVGKELTRGEFVAVLCRMFGWDAASPGAPSFSDCPASHWAYSYVAVSYTHLLWNTRSICARRWSWPGRPWRRELPLIHI